MIFILITIFGHHPNRQIATQSSGPLIRLSIWLFNSLKLLLILTPYVASPCEIFWAYFWPFPFVRQVTRKSVYIMIQIDLRPLFWVFPSSRRANYDHN
jgi:hypothetical protein